MALYPKLQQKFPRVTWPLIFKVDRSVTLPYWDWSLSHLSPWRTSTLDIWSAQPWGLGGNGDDVTGCVTNGPFARDQWGIVTGNGGRTCLERKFNGKEIPLRVKASFHSGKLSVHWNGQESFSLSCELWVGTIDIGEGWN
jgi:hypothetical protein